MVFICALKRILEGVEAAGYVKGRALCTCGSFIAGSEGVTPLNIVFTSLVVYFS